MMKCMYLSFSWSLKYRSSGHLYGSVLLAIFGVGKRALSGRYFASIPLNSIDMYNKICGQPMVCLDP